MSNTAQGGELPIGVLGGGGFAQGIARASARNHHDVIMWSRRSTPIDAPRVRATSSISDLARAELIFLAVPSPYVSELGGLLGAHLDGSHLLVHVSRGLIGEDLRTITQELRHVTPSRRLGALAGPLDAKALATGSPSGAIVGTRFPEVTAAVREAIAGPALRIYDTQDVIGVEVASAMVGLLALAAGYASEAGVGPAALAVFTSRGMVEAQRIATLLGGSADTLAGLAGFGDLLAAAAGDGRPEVRLGRALARGRSIAEAGTEAGAHIEGVSIARRVAAYAERSGVEAPICRVVSSFLDGKLTTEDAIAALMARRVGRE